MNARLVLPTLVIAAGLALMAIGIAWTRLGPAPERTTAQAQAYRDASIRLHSATTQEEKAEAYKAWEPLHRELEDQRGGRVRVGLVVQMAGVGLGVIGSVWLIVRQNQAEDQRSQRG